MCVCVWGGGYILGGLSEYLFGDVPGVENKKPLGQGGGSYISSGIWRGRGAVFGLKSFHRKSKLLVGRGGGGQDPPYPK